MVLIGYFFAISVKYEANFLILFPLLLEMIWAINLLKRFPLHLLPYLVKLVTFDIIPILMILLIF